jgi:hypothetical protein
VLLISTVEDSLEATDPCDVIRHMVERWLFQVYSEAVLAAAAATAAAAALLRQQY